MFVCVYTHPYTDVRDTQKIKCFTLYFSLFLINVIKISKINVDTTWFNGVQDLVKFLFDVIV